MNFRRAIEALAPKVFRSPEPGPVLPFIDCPAYYQIKYSDQWGWCNPCFFPYGPKIWSDLAGREVRGRLQPGVAQVAFSKLPKRGHDVIGTADGALYSSRFVEAVRRLALTGVEFHPISLLPQGKDPKGDWFWALPTGWVPIDREALCGPIHRMCPKSGSIHIIQGALYQQPPMKIVFQERPRTDFFGADGAYFAKLFLTSDALGRLVAEGINKMEVEEVEVIRR
jgi:hypothetical protein